MKSINGQDTGLQQKKQNITNRLKQNGNTSSINLATGDQVMSRASLPNSPPKEKIISQQQYHIRSQKKVKNENLREDSVKQLQYDENDQLCKEIKKVNLNIMPFTSKVSNNINVSANSLTSSNNSSSFNLCQQQSKQKKELDENLKKSLPTVNESAPRMKSDRDYCLKQESIKDIQIRQQETFPVADCNLNRYSEQDDNQNLQDLNKFQSYKCIEGDKQQTQPLSLSVKYPIQQGFINLFELKKPEEQQQQLLQKPLSKSLIGSQKNGQNPIQSLEKIKQDPHQIEIESDKNNSFYSKQQQNVFQTNNDQTVKQIHLFQIKSTNQIQSKNAPEFFQNKEVLTKNNAVQVNSLFNHKNPIQNQQKIQPQSIQLSDVNSSFQEDELTTQNNGGGFYGESSPISPQPVEIPIFDLKASAVINGKQSQKDLHQRKNYSQQRKMQTPLNIHQNAKNKNENTKRESKKQNIGILNGAKEQRIVVICESSSQTREWVNRFLGMRNIQDFETFTLPGGPGCLCVEDNQERICWQNSLKQFTQSISKLYQLQEIQVYQNSNSIFNQIYNQDSLQGRGSQLQQMQENLKQACQIVKEQLQLPVKGFFINNKGIVEKIL
ncbi:hypothetical protein TTHERM_00535520 (macronuclear) [Tetrahymena thermophila SB210]|uniref:Uncharacterized protein n=1 Tax=Tetrahymena thermophila (strain SB210) TaxID=312017 RepID=I7MLW9_TETTS|nr:hypothetical protein TTHERM_00535520 [Tetrahymena thermophila SB210]EAS03216.1 hypothetical protein TTHERM_00535520 [Tetrahymena thermophila SB210]|eukprot:XP_001023461.1 hypothetical protein TTHERM_00535520 [Tetrahymena thermophila SB210]